MLMSIHPQYAEDILRGGKTVELRKQDTTAPIGTTIFLYSTAPVMAIEGTAVLAGKTVADLLTLWSHLSQLTGVSDSEFFKYFEGKTVGYGMHVTQPKHFDYPVPLDYLKMHGVIEHPPRNWIYLKPKSVELIEQYNTEEPL